MAIDASLLLERELSDENNTTLLWITFVVINIFDFITTSINIGIYGNNVEMNPIIYYVIEHYGTNAVLSWKAFWLIPVVILGVKFLKYHAILLLNVVLLLIVYSNVFLK